MALDKFVLKTADQIRDDMLRTYANGLVRRGITNPNVSSGTDIYVKYTAIANQLAVATSNTQIMGDSVMPDSAQGTDLARAAAIYGLSLRAAGGSSGGAMLSASVATPILIPVGSQLLDPTGLKYQVSVGGSYTTGARIPISAVDTGAATNLAAGIVLKWTSPPPFVLQSASVAAGGLTGGVDAESYEGLRTRLLQFIRTPPASGNWSECNATAEASTVAVQKAFTYAACNGPATVHMAVTTAPTSSSKLRSLDAITLSTVVQPAVYALLPEFVELVVTTVVNQVASVSIGMALPASTAASPPGDGTGWLDATPFPVYASSGFANVTSVTSTTVFTVNSDVAPTAGVSRICWLSPLDWKVYKATVVSFTGTGPYAITIDQPFVGISTVHNISPQAANTDAYFAAFLNMFANLGPGQKTTAAGVLPRAYRKPLVGQSWPSDIGPAALKYLSNVGPEVLDVSFLYRSAITPTVPASITLGPSILVPFNLSLYPI